MTEAQTVTAARQDGGRIPTHPTFGWARHELAALGVSVRNLTQQQVNAELRRRGYAIEDGPMPGPETRDRR